MTTARTSETLGILALKRTELLVDMAGLSVAEKLKLAFLYGMAEEKRREVAKKKVPNPLADLPESLRVLKGL